MRASIPASAQASTGLELERSRAAFPLTLTLSRGERENQPGSLENSDLRFARICGKNPMMHA